MKRLAIPFLSGLLFGVGLLVAGMTRPGKVVGFLDVTGAWDPSLAFVMVGAIGVHLVTWRLVPRLASPVLGGAWALPTRTDLDPRLLGGAAVFGIGWGLGGFCPGPAVVSLATLRSDALIFGAAMVGGMVLFEAWQRWRPTSGAAALEVGGA